MPDSRANNLHKSHSKPSHLSLRVEAVEIDKSPPRIVPFPALRDRIHRLFLYQDHLSGCHSESSSTRSGPRLVIMAFWMKVKTEVPRIVYANMLALLFIGRLVDFGLLAVMLASIRNSRALDNVGSIGKAMFSAAQDAPLLAVVGTALICGLVALSWLCWENRGKYVWLTDFAPLTTLLDSVLTFGTTLVDVCAAHGRQWIVIAFRAAAVTTTITLAAIMIYILYEGLTGSAWEEQLALKEARVA